MSKTILGMDAHEFNRWCVVLFLVICTVLDMISATLNILITMRNPGIMNPEDSVEGEEASDHGAATPEFELLNENVIKGNLCHDDQSK